MRLLALAAEDEYSYLQNFFVILKERKITTDAVTEKTPHHCETLIYISGGLLSS